MKNTTVEQIAAAFKADPRNKVFVPMPLLLQSACDETGENVKLSELTKAIADYANGDCDDKSTSIYDGAVYVCSKVVRLCLEVDEDSDVDYSIDWLEESDGSYTAEVKINT